MLPKAGAVLPNTGAAVDELPNVAFCEAPNAGGAFDCPKIEVWLPPRGGAGFWLAEVSANDPKVGLLTVDPNVGNSVGFAAPPPKAGVDPKTGGAAELGAGAPNILEFRVVAGLTSDCPNEKAVEAAAVDPNTAGAGAVVTGAPNVLRPKAGVVVVGTAPKADVVVAGTAPKADVVVAGTAPNAGRFEFPPKAGGF